LALFGSKQSAPSKELELVVKEVETRFKGKLDVVRVDAGVYPDEAARWRLRMVPTLIFFDRNSKELWRHEGRLSANELVSKLKSAGVKFRE
jgi:thioredoxin 1